MGLEGVETDLSPYAGHWVALVRGQVIAVGNTAVAVFRAAKFQRTKDEPEIVWIPGTNKPTIHDKRITSHSKSRPNR